jgi:hypothetical protein
LSSELREQVIEDTLRGAPAAKRAWTEGNMIEDVSVGLAAVKLPVTVVIGDRDQVEHEAALRRKTFAAFLPQAAFRVLKGVGHLSPLEAPDALLTPARPSSIASDGFRRSSVAQRHHGIDRPPIGAVDNRMLEIMLRFLLGRPTDHLAYRVERDLAAVSLRFLLDLLNRSGIALKRCPRAGGRCKERVAVA